MRSLLAALVVLGSAATMGCTAEITSVEAHRLVASGAQLLDVRSREEYEHGHIDGAINVPVEELEKRLADVGPRDRPLVVYCHTGMRAKFAVRILRHAGFARVYNLATMGRWGHDPAHEAPIF